MGVNGSSVFLKIIKVDVSDSGSYFCGLYTEGIMNFTVVQLNIKGKMMYKEFPTDKLEAECVFISLKGDKESHEKDNPTNGKISIKKKIYQMEMERLIIYQLSSRKTWQSSNDMYGLSLHLLSDDHYWLDCETEETSERFWGFFALAEKHFKLILLEMC